MERSSSPFWEGQLVASVGGPAAMVCNLENPPAYVSFGGPSWEGSIFERDWL